METDYGDGLMAKSKLGPIERLITEPDRKLVARFHLGFEKNVRALEIGACRVLLAHVSHAGHYMAISCKHRYPTWGEILAIRDTLFAGPTKFGALARPPGERVGLPAHTIELWEMTSMPSKAVYGPTGRPLGIERARSIH